MVRHGPIKPEIRYVPPAPVIPKGSGVEVVEGWRPYSLRVATYSLVLD